jgi:hypothetical protein
MSCHGHQHQFGGVEHVHRAGPFFRAVNQLAKARAAVGSNLEGLKYYHGGQATLKNNLSAANSRLTDVDLGQRKHELREIQHPGAVGHGAAGAGECAAAVRFEIAVIKHDSRFPC